MNLKYLTLNDGLYAYACRSRSHADDPLLGELQKETLGLTEEFSRMQISPEQGSFLTLLTTAIGAKSTLEIGTFTGYSSICIARGLSNGGRLLCLDVSSEWTDIARRYWEKAGLQDRIELRLGPAIEALDNLETERMFDLAFIDADKTEYDAYFERILPRIQPNGLILFDNMLWGGKLGTPAGDDDAGRAIDALNQKLSKDPRIETVLLPFADGIQFCRKR